MALIAIELFVLGLCIGILLFLTSNVATSCLLIGYKVETIGSNPVIELKVLLTVYLPLITGEAPSESKVPLGLFVLALSLFLMFLPRLGLP